jgi:hypothetical protein
LILFGRPAQAFWSELRRAKLSRRGSHCAAIDLLLAVVRYNRYEPPGTLIDCLKRVEETETQEQLKEVIDGCCLEMLRRNFQAFAARKSRLVEKMKQQIQDNLTNPELSLKWLAGPWARPKRSWIWPRTGVFPWSSFGGAGGAARSRGQLPPSPPAAL